MSKLKKTVKKFIKENEIHCPETIYQCDWVAQNALEFIEELCDIVGYENLDDED